MQARWHVVGLCLALLTVAQVQAAPAFVRPARVVVADWVVTGTGEPRYWLGPVYGEVLVRRLRLCSQLLLTAPLAVRQSPASGTAVTDMPSMQQAMSALQKQFGADYVMGGFITDQGAKLTVQPVVLLKGRTECFAPTTAEVTLPTVFKPQVDIVVGQFFRQMGLRVDPKELLAMQNYAPEMSDAEMALIGNGWRTWLPERPEAAFAKWQEAQRLNPKSEYAADALAATGGIYHRSIVAMSLKNALTQVRQRPVDAEAHYQLAEVYAEMGQWTEAVGFYKQAIQHRPNFVDAMIGLSVAYLQINRNQDALDTCLAVNQLEPSNRLALYNGGIAWLRKGYRDEAMTLWLRALKLYPDDPLLRKAVDSMLNVGASGPEVPDHP